LNPDRRLNFSYFDDSPSEVMTATRSPLFKEGERLVTIASSSESTTGIVRLKHLISLWKLNYQIPGHLTNLQFRINQRNQRSSRLVSVAVGGSWWGY
jgi:hypothetical protein